MLGQEGKALQKQAGRIFALEGRWRDAAACYVAAASTSSTSKGAWCAALQALKETPEDSFVGRSEALTRLKWLDDSAPVATQEAVVDALIALKDQLPLSSIGTA